MQHGSTPIRSKAGNGSTAIPAKPAIRVPVRESGRTQLGTQRGKQQPSAGTQAGADRSVWAPRNSVDIMDEIRLRKGSREVRTIGDALWHLPWFRGFGWWTGPAWSSFAGPAGVSLGTWSAPGGSGDVSGDGAAQQAADPPAMIQAEGQFIKDQQEAAILKTQAEKGRLENRRLKFDQEAYEAERTPTTEETRQLAQRTKLMRSLNNPPLPEIHDGEALNAILDFLKTLPDAALAHTDARLDAASLKCIRVASSKGSNLDVFKNEGRLEWSPALKDDAFDAERNQVDRAARELFLTMDKIGRLDPVIHKRLSQAVDNVQAKLKQHANELDAAAYIQAKRYLRTVDAAVAALAKADAADPLQERARGRTVRELVKHMATRGLRFAAATYGDEDAYVALHTALVSACDSVARETTSKR